MIAGIFDKHAIIKHITLISTKAKQTNEPNTSMLRYICYAIDNLMLYTRLIYK